MIKVEIIVFKKSNMPFFYSNLVSALFINRTIDWLFKLTKTSLNREFNGLWKGNDSSRRYIDLLENDRVPWIHFHKKILALSSERVLWVFLSLSKQLFERESIYLKNTWEKSDDFSVYQHKLS